MIQKTDFNLELNLSIHFNWPLSLTNISLRNDFCINYWHFPWSTLTRRPAISDVWVYFLSQGCSTLGLHNQLLASPGVSGWGRRAAGGDLALGVCKWVSFSHVALWMGTSFTWVLGRGLSSVHAFQRQPRAPGQCALWGDRGRKPASRRLLTTVALF